MRLVGVRTLIALVFIACVSAATLGFAMQPQVVPNRGSLIAPVWMPLGLKQGDVTVVVELAGDPVAIRQAKVGRKLARAEKELIKSELSSVHDMAHAAIEGLGGAVLADYKSAYNGIKVRIARERIDRLRSLPGVVAVHPLQVMKPSNIHGIPLIGAPMVWDTLGLHGEGVKIAVIDSGIDYTHANFGGPGTAAAYSAAHMNETLPADPSLFGPGAPRVKGGTDLVGDSYDADPTSPSYQPIPQPDLNPLDCNGHGSHVAGTAAGSGVTAAGATYGGTYDATTVSGNSWTIGPGVAPKADIYAVRVFGCQGATDVVLDGIEWAVENEMDVINMSLGSPFGSKDDPSSAASTNAAEAGIIVVAAAGNEGENPYVAGSPATADGAISVAANDPNQNYPGATISLSNGTTVTALNANNYSFSGPLKFTLKVIADDPTTNRDESLGCSIADFGAPLPANTIAVVNRGVCARVAKAIFGQQAGAAAVVMVNNAPGLPPFEGTITSNPDDGVPFNVTIPFLGVTGPPTDPSTDGAVISAANGLGATVAPALISNSDFKAFASFSSAGPRSGDSVLKPDITAPGVSITSTLSGSGNLALTISGTSMASPHVAGSAALVRQAHPTWSVEDIKAAIINTGDPSGVLDYGTSLGGTGLVQPAKSTLSQVVASADGGELAVALNYGYQELAQDFSQVRAIKLKNNGSAAATFTVAEVLPSGSPHSVSFDRSSLSVPAGGEVDVQVNLTVPVATVGDANGPGLSFHEVSGVIEFTPATALDNAGVTLRVPYYLVPRASSNVSTRLGRFKGTNPSTNATVANVDGAIAGNADFYAWGIESPGGAGEGSYRVRAIGTQSFAMDPATQLLVFAVNTFDRWSNPAANEFDIFVDVDGDGVDDYIVVGADQGAVETGAFNGQMGTFVFSTRSPGASTNFLANAPTDRSVAELPVLTSQLCRPGEPCLSASNPRITYHAQSFDVVNGNMQTVKGSARYNVWSSAISTGAFLTVAPRAVDSSTPIAVNSAEWVITPAKGLMIVTLDNPSGAEQAQLIEVTLKQKH